MSANDIQQSLLDAMQLLSTKAANSTKAAITIKGEIVEELDAGSYQYAVSYGGTTYKDAYALGNVSYPTSTIVYILIPNGNFDEPKIILKAATTDATNYVTESETDTYVPITSNLFGTENSIDLQSWVNETQVLDLDTDNFGIVFQDYLNTYRNFVFSALIKTEIDKDHQAKGNYGLVLNLPFIQTSSEGTTSEIWKSYVMDVSTMPGNPYAFNEYNRINLYYEIDDTLEYDISRIPFISAFTQDFGYTEARTDIDYDIHIRNISMKMVDVLSEADTTGYYLAVVPTEGNYFLNGKYVNKKTLSPLLKVNSKTTSTTDWECYWFVEDSSIDITSEGYLTIGGLGWKCLNGKTNVRYDEEGNKTFQYVTSNQTLEVNDTDIVSSLRYKCVLTKDDIVVGGSVKLKNLNSSIEVSLVSATGSNTFIENIGNVRLIARIKYPGATDSTTSSIGLSTQWQRFNQYGDYIDNDFYSVVRYNDPVDGYYETEISFPCSILEKLNTVNCTFYSTTTLNNAVVQNNLGTASIIITTSAELTYGVTIDNGDVLYKYDSDGDSPMIANYDGPASSKVSSINPITFRVFKTDGSELDSVEYLYAKYKWSFPKNSMMKLKGYTTDQLSKLEQDDDYYYISGWGQSNLNYTILDVYNKKKDNNTILLNIEIDKNQLSSSANPKFLKDGEGGTNGSKYAALLTYQDYAYGERDSNGILRKLQAVYIAGTGWKLYDNENKKLVDFDSPTLVPLVYRDGERITSGYTISWGMFDSTQTNSCFGVVGGVVSIKTQWTDATAIYCSIVECAITINEDSSTNSPEVIYAYYPIEITRILNSAMADNIVPSLDGGFEEVVYASDGTNPQYDNTNAFECINDTYNDDINDYYDYNWSCSNNLKLASSTNTSYSASIKPVTKFDNGLTKNYVKVVLTMSAARRSEIQENITKVTSEISTIQDKINFYQHNRTYILDFVQKFEYNNYEEKLNNSKTLLSYRYTLLDYIPKLREKLEELNAYCIKKNIKIADFNYTNYYSSFNTVLNTAYENLYLLGYTKTFENIKDLTDLIITVDKTSLTKKYNATIAKKIYNLVTDWSSLVNKYQETYVKIVQQSNQQYVLQTDYDNLASFDKGIRTFVNDSDLDYLTTKHDNNDPEQEFVHLQEVLFAYFTLIENSDSKQLTSYSSFVSEVLKPINESLAIYKNTSYQESYYNEKNTSLNATLTTLKEQKASYEASLLPAQTDYITHIKPIVMLFNRYELGNINGWDGSKLYIDSTNNEYILAPQVGAGAKKNGLFTGVIMGVKQFNASSTQHIGLFGYGSGVQSFFLNSDDGSLILGKSGSGQIISDPSQSKALLYSSNYWKNYNNDGKPSSYGSTNINSAGMLIDLTTPEIKFGSGNFSVNSSGEITAKGGGTIAGWKINDTQIYSNVTTSNGRLTMDSSGAGKIYSHNHSTLDKTNEGFYLSADGLSLGNSIRISSADNGTILVGRVNGKAWTISGSSSNSYIAYGTTTFNSGSTSVYLGTNGISLGSDKFYVTSKGYLTSKEGTIGGWHISDDVLTGGNTTLNSNGTITCSNLIASTDGSIGGWRISSSGLSSNGISINSNGSISSKNWQINGNGNAKFNDITCNGTWSFGSGSNTWTNSGFSWGNGSLNLGSSGYGNNGISWNGNNATVSGTLYAQSGHIGGSFVVDGDVVAKGINANNITVGTLSADRIDVKTLVSKFTSSMDASFGVLSCTQFIISGDGRTIYLSRSDFEWLESHSEDAIPKGGYVKIGDTTYNITFTYS